MIESNNKRLEIITETGTRYIRETQSNKGYNFENWTRIKINGEEETLESAAYVPEYYWAAVRKKHRGKNPSREALDADIEIGRKKGFRDNGGIVIRLEKEGDGYTIMGSSLGRIVQS